MYVLYLTPKCQCFDLLPMPCNASLTDSCTASLYYVPREPKNIKEAAFLLNVPSYAINVTTDGFLIGVLCECPAEHREFIWHTMYSVQFGDTWKLISEKFGLLVLEKPEKHLLATLTVTLDFWCGCVEGMDLVTYTIQQGDTLYGICSRFGVDMERVKELNEVVDESMIHAGDRLFIPATGVISYPNLRCLNLLMVRMNVMHIVHSLFFP